MFWANNSFCFSNRNKKKNRPRDNLVINDRDYKLALSSTNVAVVFVDIVVFVVAAAAVICAIHNYTMDQSPS